ncbi:DUF2971 domain-containing protein [Marisediminitalea sp.]|uniref:DUF2971 domain-containing protein n=1 Tax=Marisediminitalea sp. TaxID=2662268 RepID=UPI00351850D5
MDEDELQLHELMLRGGRVRLFRFRSFTDLFIHELVTNQFWFSSKKHLNDPCEGIFHHGDNHPAPREYPHLKKFTVCCLTQTNNNLMMWAHYADNHKGVCLELDVMVSSGTHNGYHGPQKIHYSEHPPAVEQVIDRVDKKGHRSGQLIKYIQSDPDSTKSTLWEHEKEFRLTGFNDGPNDAGHLVPLGDNIKIIGVYFGLKAQQYQIDILDRILDSKIPFYQASDVITSYDVEFSPLSRSSLDANLR